MQTWDMFQHKEINGFTMVELLVVMILISLIGGIIAPNINQWITSREVAEQKKRLEMEISALVPKAYFSESPIVISEAEQLNTKVDGMLTFEEPITVMSNGYCKGGKIKLRLDEALYDISVSEPLCNLVWQPAHSDS